VDDLAGALARHAQKLPDLGNADELVRHDDLKLRSTIAKSQLRSRRQYPWAPSAGTDKEVPHAYADGRAHLGAQEKGHRAGLRFRSGRAPRRRCRPPHQWVGCQGPAAPGLPQGDRPLGPLPGRTQRRYRGTRRTSSTTARPETPFEKMASCCMDRSPAPARPTPPISCGGRGRLVGDPLAPGRFSTCRNRSEDFICEQCTSRSCSLRMVVAPARYSR
jgi:hypothetical protein